jgi:hypothetical protein
MAEKHGAVSKALFSLERAAICVAYGGHSRVSNQSDVAQQGEALKLSDLLSLEVSPAFIISSWLLVRGILPWLAYMLMVRCCAPVSPCRPRLQSGRSLHLRSRSSHCQHQMLR